MNTLYLLGGPPRTAKTTIMCTIAVEKKIPSIATDAINHGVRNLLTGKPHQMLRRIELSGHAEHKTSITSGGQMIPFSSEGTEVDFTLRAISGMLDYYKKNGSSVAFEGSAFTPERVSQIKPEGFVVRAAFVGYTKPSHADAILAHAKENPSDWINVWLLGENGDEESLREWIAHEADEGKRLKEIAEVRGYPFFDISTLPFAEYLASIQQYFLAV